MNKEDLQVDIREILGFDPETGDRYEQHEPLYKPHKTVSSESYKPEIRFTSIEDLKNDPDKWFSLLSFNEKRGFLAHSERSITEIYEFIANYESPENKERLILQRTDHFALVSAFEGSLHINSTARQNIRKQEIDKSFLRDTSFGSRGNYFVRQIVLLDLLQLAKLDESKLLNIVNRLYDRRSPAFGLDGTLQLISDYIEKPIVGQFVGSDSYMEYLPRRGE